MTQELEDADLITRRAAIQRVMILFGGGALVSGSALLTGCGVDFSGIPRPAAFTPEDIAFLDDVAETMLPATSTPGAKAAKVGAFMALMVADTYSLYTQVRFRAGMRRIERASKNAYGTPFVSATPQQRLSILRTFDAEQKAYSESHEAAGRKEDLAKVGIQAPAVPASPGAPILDSGARAHWFRMMKELALLGYFTSEVGCTKAQRYVESPGKFEPCLPYVPGEPTWAGHA